MVINNEKRKGKQMKRKEVKEKLKNSKKKQEQRKEQKGNKNEKVIRIKQLSGCKINNYYLTDMKEITHHNKR